MIGSELGYNAGQLGNDWEDDIWIVHHPDGVNHVSIYDDIAGLVYSYGEPVPYAEEVYKQKGLKRKGSLGKAENDVLQVSSLSGYLKSYKSKKSDIAFFRLVLSDNDLKIVENNLKNSTNGLIEFKCIGNKCSDNGIKTARESGRYYLSTGEKRYGLLKNNCTVFVLRQFKGTSKERKLSNIGILPSNLRDFAISNNNSDMLKYYDYNGSRSTITMDLNNKTGSQIKKELKRYE